MTIAKRRGPRIRQGDMPSTRQELLEAAHELMIEKDTVEISINEIAERTGLSPALVQYHFGNKDGLLVALLERQRTRPGQLENLLEADLTAVEKLEMHVRGIFNVYHRAPYLNRLILTLLRRDSEVAEHVAENFIKPLSQFHEQLIAQGVADGTLRPINPMSFNFILVGACDNLFSRRAALPVAFGIPEITEDLKRRHREELLSIFLHGLMPPFDHATDAGENLAVAD